MRNSRKTAAAVAALLSFGLVAAACGSSSNSSSNTTSGGASTTASANAATTAAGPTTTAGHTGGTIVLGNEQEPDCMDWMGSCGGASWGYWAVGVQTMPFPYDIVKNGDNWEYKASNVLTGEPTLVSSPKQVVTYKINPAAVWSDGTPISSTDFKYTVEQVQAGKDIYDTTGFNQIESVNDSDPATAVITFKTPYASWNGLFQQYGIFPSHILQGKDRDALMKDGYTWSAGPWKLQAWNKGVDIALVPNDKYWGQKPLVDKVDMKFLTDSAAEFQAFKSGQVFAIGPQPQLDAIDQINAGPSRGHGGHQRRHRQREALWMNNGKAPFDDVAVRQAIGYAIDRNAIVNRLFGGIGVKEAINSLNPPIQAAVLEPTGVRELQARPRPGQQHHDRRGLCQGFATASGPRAARRCRSSSSPPPATSAVS